MGMIKNKRFGHYMDDKQKTRIIRIKSEKLIYLEGLKKYLNRPWYYKHNEVMDIVRGKDRRP